MTDPKKIWIIALSVMICAVVARFLHLTEFFPNLDDTHVLYAIFFKYDELRQKIYNPENDTKQLFLLLRTIDQYGIIELLYPPMSVSFLTTFAPFQFFITNLLVSPDDSYTALLWWGRFPSVIFALIAIVNVGLFFLLSHYAKEKIISIPVMTLMAFSWESIIASQQMHNYCAGLAAATFLLLALRCSYQASSYRKAIMLGLLVGFLAWWQYSMLYYGASLLIYYFVGDMRKKESSFVRKILYWSTTGFVYLIVITPLLGILKYTNMLSLSTNYWNIGDDGEYLFTIPQNITDALIYVPKFFLFNFYKTFSAITAFVSYQSTIFYVSSAILFALFVIGGVALVFYYKEMRFFVEFIAILAFVLISLIVFQKLTLSPTRHQLTLLPFISVIIGYGIQFLWDITKSSLVVRMITAVSFFLLIGGLFAIDYSTEYHKRKAHYSEADFQGFLRNAPQKPVLIEYNWTTVAQLMTDIKKEYSVFTAKNLEDLPKSYPSHTQSVIAFNFLGNSASSDSVWFVEMMKPLKPDIEISQIRIDTLRAISTPYSFGYISLDKMLKNNMYVYQLSIKENKSVF